MEDLLRFTTAGSVDDGKSTLIGRLLYDSRAVYEDQVAAARRVTRAGSAGALDFSLLTDGLRAEREQGITIDVAYRYFSTPKRKFIIADAPGHEQYTRNMATAASNADLAVILIDARHGVLPQSRRHAYIASLLGIPRVIAAINKMDQVQFGEQIYRSICAEFKAYATAGLNAEVEFIPISALDGDNVVERSVRMPWYEGPSLLERLETVPLPAIDRAAGFRFPVQYVIRAGDFRGFAGRIAAGSIRPGDRLRVAGSGRESRVRRIVSWEGDLEQAFAPMSVTLCLEDEIDISRGDMLVSPQSPPRLSAALEVNLVWMNERPLRPGRAYLLKHSASVLRARADETMERVDVNTLETEPAESLSMNEIGRVMLRLERPLAWDPYLENRATGALILIDAVTNETVGAGMIVAAGGDASETGPVRDAERQLRNGHRAAVVNASDENQATRIERALFGAGIHAFLLQRDIPDAQFVSSAHALYKSGAVVILAGSPPPLPGLYTIDMTREYTSDNELLVRIILKKLAVR